MNITPEAEAKLHRDRLVTVIESLERNRAEWDEPIDPEDEPDGKRTATRDGLRVSLEAFRDMRARGVYPLSDKQHQWILDIAERCNITIPHPPVPRGREVPLAFAPGPLKPPGRK